MGQDEHIPLTEEQRENAEKLSAHAQQVNNTAFSQSKTQVNPLPLDAPLLLTLPKKWKNYARL